MSSWNTLAPGIPRGAAVALGCLKGDRNGEAVPPGDFAKLAITDVLLLARCGLGASADSTSRSSCFLCTLDGVSNKVGVPLVYQNVNFGCIERKQPSTPEANDQTYHFSHAASGCCDLRSCSIRLTTRSLWDTMMRVAQREGGKPQKHDQAFKLATNRPPLSPASRPSVWSSELHVQASSDHENSSLVCVAITPQQIREQAGLA
jgi:hypothetical protein